MDSMWRLSVGLLALTSSAFCFPGAVFAQPQSAGTGSQNRASAALVQTPPSDDADEIVVTALKTPGQTALNAPAAISVLSGKQIESFNPTSLKDFLAQTPGLSIDSGIAGAQTIGIRGINPSFGSASVGFYVDDLPFSFINVNILPDLSPFDLQSIEILRGPQSALYGAGASGGVVRLRTNDPSFDGVSGAIETYGTSTHSGGESYSVAGVVNVPIVADVLSFRGSVSYQDFAGWIDDAYKAPGVDPDYGKDVNDEQKLVLRGKLLLKASENLTLLGLATYSRDDTGMVPLSDDARRFPRSFDTSSTEKFTQYGLKATYETDSFAIINTVGHITADRDFTYPDYAQFRQLTTVKSLTDELTLSSRGSSRFTWLAGLFYRDTKQRTDIDFTRIGLPFNLPDAAAARQTALYGNAGYQIVPDQLEVNLGGSISFDRTHQTTRFVLNANGDALVASGVPAQAFLPSDQPGQKIKSDIFSPKVSVTWRPRRGASLYAVYSKGFRAGFNDFGFSTYFSRQGILAAGGDPTLVTGAVNPERVEAYEIGAKANWLDGLLYTELALFQNDLTNSQQSAAVADPTSGVTTNAAVNIGSARTRGVELLVNVKGPIAGTNLSLTGSYIDARVTRDASVGNLLVFEKGDRLNGTPELTLGANGNFRFPVADGRMHLGGFISALYTSPRSISQLGIAPFKGDSTTRVDARLQLERDALTLYVFGQNLLDDNGRISPSVRSSPGYPGSVQNLGIAIDGLLGTRLRPRTLGIGARLSF